MAEHKNNNALVIKTVEGKRALVKDLIPAPEPYSNQALIRVSHVAQNSMDVEALDSGEFSDGSVLGCDFVGTVEKIGKDVSLVKNGDIIAGMIFGGEIKGLGGYSGYTLADERLCFKIPPTIALEEAVTVPFAACTAYLGLFSKECLNIDIKTPGVSILVWGASSCVGRFAVQIASIYRLRVIAACGPRNFHLLRSLGADHVLDYRDADVLSRIQELAPDLEYVFDTVGSPSHSSTVSRALTGRSRSLCTVLPGDEYNLGVAQGTRVCGAHMWKPFLRDHCIDGIPLPPSVHDHQLASELFHALPNWLRDGIIKPNHPRVLPGGLYAVQQGFEMDRSDRPLDCKLVYQI